MKLADIPRVKAGMAAGTCVRDLGELEKERLSLGKRAADLLGYRGLVRSVTGEVHRLVKPGKLADALNRLDIPVLDLASVLDYQMQEMVHLTRTHIEAGNLDDWAHGYFNAAQWSHTSLSDYTEDVPEFALDIAIRIKEAYPEARLHVQYTTAAKSDPFLIVHDGAKEIYYVAAWDEPGFEGRTRTPSPEL